MSERSAAVFPFVLMNNARIKGSQQNRSIQTATYLQWIGKIERRLTEGNEPDLF